MDAIEPDDVEIKQESEGNEANKGTLITVTDEIGKSYSYYKLPSVAVRKFACDHPSCTYRTTTSTSLKVHKMTHAKNKSFKCNLCNYAAKTPQGVRQHQKVHKCSKEFACKKCDYKSVSASHLKRHMFTHLKKKPMQCPECDYSCTQGFQLRNHLLLHKVDNPYVCDVCGAKYRTEASLKFHFLTHEQITRYKCSDCSYAGNRYSDFRRHVLTHSKNKPLVCNLCGYSCIRQSRLNIHMAKNHGEDEKPQAQTILQYQSIQCDNDGIYHCSACKYTTAKKNFFIKHLHKVHQNVVEKKPVISQFEQVTQAATNSQHLQTYHTESQAWAHIAQQNLLSQQNQLHQAEDSTVMEAQDVAQQHQKSVISELEENQRVLQIQETVYQQAVELPQFEQASIPLTSQQIIVTDQSGQEQIYQIQGDQGLDLNIPVTQHNAITFQRMDTSMANSNTSYTFVASEEGNTLTLVPTTDGQITMDPNGELALSGGQLIDTYEDNQDDFTTEPQQTIVAISRENGKTTTEDGEWIPDESIAAILETLENDNDKKKGLSIQNTPGSSSAYKMFHCPHCSFSCDYESNYKRHLLRHEKVKPFKCDQCKYSCTTASALKKHMFRHIKDKSYKCGVCDFTSKRRDGVLLHMKKHVQQTVIKCSHCEFTCKSSGGMKSHMLTHTGEKPYTCEICGKVSNTIYLFKKHLMTHSKSKPMKCDICDYQCIYKKQLDNHKLLHTCQFPFQCSLCNANYKKEESLKIHMLSHSNIRQYSCDLCTYAGNRAADFKRHMLTHAASKPLQCHLCTYSCIRKNRLKSHIQTVHSNTKAFKCSYCAYGCNRASRLKSHMVKVHDVKQYQLKEEYVMETL